MDKQRLVDIFRDAHVVDIDMSQWDRRVGLVVVALEETAFPSKRLPVYVVNLKGVTALSMKFNHHETPPHLGHQQWNIHDLKLTDLEQGYQMVVSAGEVMPVVSVTFADAEVSPIDHSTLDRNYPGWNKPGSPFLRPGVGF